MWSNQCKNCFQTTKFFFKIIMRANHVLLLPNLLKRYFESDVIFNNFLNILHFLGYIRSTKFYISLQNKLFLHSHCDCRHYSDSDCLTQCAIAAEFHNYRRSQLNFFHYITSPQAKIFKDSSYPNWRWFYCHSWNLRPFTPSVFRRFMFQTLCHR